MQQTSFATAMAIWEFCSCYCILFFGFCTVLRLEFPPIFGPMQKLPHWGLVFGFRSGFLAMGLATRVGSHSPVTSAFKSECLSVGPSIYGGHVCGLSVAPANFITIMSVFVRSLLIRLLPLFPLVHSRLVCLLNESWCCFLKFRNHFDHLSPTNCLQLDAFNKKKPEQS